MTRLRSVTLALAALILTSAASAAPGERKAAATIEKIVVRLAYHDTGSFSDDIAPPARFSGWNTIIGEGDAKGPANDILVQVHLKANVDEGNLDEPLVVEVKGDGKRLAGHRVTAMFFRGGKTVRSFMVYNATCAGMVEVVATHARQRKATGVKLACGE